MCIDHVAGNQAAGEEHGDKNEPGEECFQPVIRTAERESHGRGRHQTDHRTDNGDADGIQECTADIAGLPGQIGIGSETQFIGDKTVALHSDGCLRRERNNQHQQGRHQADQCQKNEQTADQYIRKRLDPRVFQYTVFCFLGHRLTLLSSFPASIRTIRLPDQSS